MGIAKISGCTTLSLKIQGEGRVRVSYIE